jgi:frataxin-like iron-binding protein CyaY
MDKVTQHQEKVIALLKTYISKYSDNFPELKDQLICDYETHNYQLVTVGWDNRGYHYIVNFHFHITPQGKIWLLVNNTDIRIAEELVTFGVPRTDIVLGFQSPEIRPYTNFAVA